jgi:hypothetical protein
MLKGKSSDNKRQNIVAKLTGKGPLVQNGYISFMYCKLSYTACLGRKEKRLKLRGIGKTTTEGTLYV